MQSRGRCRWSSLLNRRPARLGRIHPVLLALLGIVTIVVLVFLAVVLLSRDALYVNALRTGDATQVRILLQLGADPNAIDDLGCSPLFSATLAQDTQLAQLLLDAGASVDIGDTTDDISPLRNAVAMNDTAMVRLLVERGANVNHTDAFIHETPLHQAAHEGNAEIVAMLLAAGANPAMQNSYGHTPLEIAESCGHSDIAAMLSR